MISSDKYGFLVLSAIFDKPEKNRKPSDDASFLGIPHSHRKMAVLKGNIVAIENAKPECRANRMQ
jgi:hypothetical protein